MKIFFKIFRESKSMYRNLIFLLAIVVVGFISLYSSCNESGWIIKIKTTIEDNQYNSVLYMQGKNIKVVKDKYSLLLKGDSREICLINTIEKSYWRGSIDQFVNIMNCMDLPDVEQYSLKIVEYIKNFSPQHMLQGEATKSVKCQKQSLNLKDRQIDLEIEFERTCDIASIAGYIARRYFVWVEGKLKQEVWLGENLISNDFWNPKLVKEILNNRPPHSHYMYSQAYLEFEKRGFPLKTVTYDCNCSLVEVAETVIEKNLSDSLFAPPADFAVKNLGEVINLNK